MYSAKVRENSIKMKKNMRVLHFFLVAVMVIILAAAAPKVWAGGWGGDWASLELDEAEIFFEENTTDGDLGIQFFLDGEGWKRISIITPDWRRSVTISVSGKLGKIGLTEIFSESAEPSYNEEDELSREEFLALFKEGEYRFFGCTVDGNLLYGTAELTKDLLDAPELNVENFPKISWTGDPEAVGYEVVAEMVIEEDGEESEFVNTATLPAFVTQFTVSREFVRLVNYYEGEEVLKELKIEIIAREESGNKTITEVPLFELEEEE